MSSSGTKIGPPSSSPFNGRYSLDDNLPVSFPRAIQASNAMNFALVPFRLALPRAGNEQVNEMQQTIHLESFAHLNDLLCNDGELAARLIRLITECIRSGGSSMRDEALQNGVVHVLATLVRKVLIRGARLGLVGDKKKDEPAPPTRIVSRRTAGQIGASSENFDYDKDHESSSPPAVPPAIAFALVGLIDACCGLAFDNIKMEENASSSAIVLNPCRGLLRVRRASDLALTALFGLAMDFDLLGNDPTAAAPILKAIASRYCQADGSAVSGNHRCAFIGEDYGSLLRKQINLQYFLDCIRIRFDHSVAPSSPTNGLAAGQQLSLASAEMDIASVASSLSDILYAMLLSTLTSAAGISVSRGERDVGALVATLTECPLGSVCAHVVTTCIARLLVKCGVMSSLCLGNSASQSRNYRKRKSNGRRDPGDIALESRLGRNLLLCHYHDIVAPLLLSRSTPRSSTQPEDSDHDDDSNDELSQSVDFASMIDADDTSHPLDWTHHWRLSLLTFAVSYVGYISDFYLIQVLLTHRLVFLISSSPNSQWLSSLAGIDESHSISNSTGNLLLLAGKAGSLNGAILGHQCHKEAGGDMLAVLSHFLVLSSSREKDNR